MKAYVVYSWVPVYLYPKVFQGTFIVLLVNKDLAYSTNIRSTHAKTGYVCVEVNIVICGIWCWSRINYD